MRALDRLTTVVVALAFVLAGLGAPACAETHGPGAVRAAHQHAVHEGPAACTPDHAPSELRAELSGGPCGDHRAGVASGDGPDDLLPAAPPRVGTPPPAAVPTRYRQPAVPMPPRGTLPARAPPAAA
ncbi:hypothetical protein GCM10010169_31310 [Micromonospora fulviviridis]|uniref:hypothetical protein n=1 Tax=Micromonospora fulviviridis TaxID=47860 RepID=UPI001669F32E|nr:hypothetical protein [Micromonospora fulviviridis]GGR84769.1 hypothetical protein GCM10010169_31310 [Micromonospora fulviviridis]